jgi:hypothetical protein
MSAIEYGSYYWCVILKSKENDDPAESIHLHADGIAVDPNGALTFISKGRRPAGTEPGQEPKAAANGAGGEAKKEEKAGEHAGMIYFAVAPGAWKVAYAAKLQDGTPASVEHWNLAMNSPEAALHRDAGAVDYMPAK